MTPKYTIVDSPLGALTVVADDGALTGLYFPHHWTRPDRTSFGLRDDVAFDEVTRQLKEYFAGERREFDLPMRAEGDQFDRSVWAEIAKIPYGETATYGDIATALHDPTAARAVGAAVGRNPLSILVACHRVVGKNGVLTGYAGGLQRKRHLLELEQPASEERGQLW
jgi:methylated-DNA-[protein]-cysteine S-methyltransferase